MIKVSEKGLARMVCKYQSKVQPRWFVSIGAKLIRDGFLVSERGLDKMV